MDLKIQKDWLVTIHFFGIMALMSIWFFKTIFFIFLWLTWVIMFHYEGSITIIFTYLYIHIFFNEQKRKYWIKSNRMPFCWHSINGCYVHNRWNGCCSVMMIMCPPWCLLIGELAKCPVVFCPHCLICLFHLSHNVLYCSICPKQIWWLSFSLSCLLSLLSKRLLYIHNSTHTPSAG